MNPSGTDRGVGGLLAAADRASRRATALHAHMLADLLLTDEDRVSDEVRATWRQLLDNAVDEVEWNLRESIHNDQQLPVLGEGVKRALDTPYSLTRAILDRAGFPDQPDFATSLLTQARNITFRRKMMIRSRHVGDDDPVRRLSNEQSDMGSWATALLLAQSISEGPGAAPALGAEDQHMLVWAVAASLRVALADDASDLDALDRIVTESASRLLSEHQEARAVDVIASRLARMSDGVLDPVDVLAAGYPELSAALLSQMTGIDRSLIDIIQHESDGARLALLLKSIGVERADAARVFVALSDVRLSGMDLVTLMADYDSLRQEDARRAISKLRLDPDYTRAVSQYSDIEP